MSYVGIVHMMTTYIRIMRMMTTYVRMSSLLLSIVYQSLPHTQSLHLLHCSSVYLSFSTFWKERWVFYRFTPAGFTLGFYGVEYHIRFPLGLGRVAP